MVKRLLALVTLLAVPVSAGSTSGNTLDDIRSRLEPFGSSCLEGDEACGSVPEASPVAVAVVADEPLSGQEVYDRFCFVCHAAGVAEAPVFQDADQWAPRLEKGMDELLRTSTAGLGAMPPKGTCMTCSDDEMVDAIRYLSAAE